jgi:glyoxylase-like metal-dependent hydrolase (beta-lactamase superfamily II)
MSEGVAATLRSLGALVLQRDWLSANQVVFGDAGPQAPATVVDTGYARHAEIRSRWTTGPGGPPLARIVNTHLHPTTVAATALQARHPAATFVPAPRSAAARGTRSG